MKAGQVEHFGVRAAHPERDLPGGGGMNGVMLVARREIATQMRTRASSSAC